MLCCLGLDISTSKTGWCVLYTDEHQSVSKVEMGCIHLSGWKDTFSKAQRVLDVLQELQCQHPVERVFVEENLQRFRRGFSSAKTLASLARFNGVVSYLSESTFKIRPEFLNVNSARKSVGLRLQKEAVCGKTTKQQVLDWVSNRLDDDYQWPLKVLKSGPRRGQEILEPGCYDMADAYVVAFAGVLNNNT